MKLSNILRNAVELFLSLVVLFISIIIMYPVFSRIFEAMQSTIVNLFGREFDVLSILYIALVCFGLCVVTVWLFEYIKKHQVKIKETLAYYKGLIIMESIIFLVILVVAWLAYR